MARRGDLSGARARGKVGALCPHRSNSKPQGGRARQAQAPADSMRGAQVDKPDMLNLKDKIRFLPHLFCYGIEYIGSRVVLTYFSGVSAKIVQLTLAALNL